MIKIKEAVIVEGKYDKIKLSGILDAVIIETDGFGIFKDKEKQKLIRFLAENKGIIIMTDSDSAGFKIRSFIQNITKSENIKNVFMPDIYGKEKRKTEASKEGKLGVEGIKKEIILCIFLLLHYININNEYLKAVSAGCRWYYRRFCRYYRGTFRGNR